MIRNNGQNYDKKFCFNSTTTTTHSMVTTHTQLSHSHHSLHPVCVCVCVYTWRFVSCPERWRLAGRSLNTGVNTVLLSTSNALTEGGRRGGRRSFEALHRLSLRPLSIPPIFHPFLHPCPPFVSCLCLFLPLQPPQLSCSSSHFCTGAADFGDA